MKRHVEVRPVGGPYFDGSPPDGSPFDNPPIDSNVIDAEFQVRDDLENPPDA